MKKPPERRALTNSDRPKSERRINSIPNNTPAGENYLEIYTRESCFIDSGFDAKLHQRASLYDKSMMCFVRSQENEELTENSSDIGPEELNLVRMLSAAKIPNCNLAFLSLQINKPET